MGFSKCKKGPMEQQRRLTTLQERTLLKLLFFGGGSSLVRFSKMYLNKTTLIINSLIKSDKTAKRITAKKD